ncbi:unnamed protein product [Rotaria socialis]|uniref:Uncharacterized protein n=1 Tax=Rotaria socialis TaxID=392032 RepID=A0A818FHQ3_9BILA|nr:unnamed protein product [Rotaria socialis]CAF3355940.1 unnamed protein product [Rotaria socialis]CAF3473765.1 unnamed protein product [Rotaria socialis]CAF4469358.1 unnamed protein product [Rotaria socialis]CAF4601765.1 unnamed protein product [Rotaria socialis]
MSLKQEQNQKFGLRTGLTMFNSHMVPTNASDNTEKSHDESCTKKESTLANNASSTKNSVVTSNTPPPSSVKPVGSNKFFMPNKK